MSRGEDLSFVSFRMALVQKLCKMTYLFFIVRNRNCCLICLEYVRSEVMIAFRIKTIEKFKHHGKKSSFSTAPSVHDTTLVYLFNFTDRLLLSFKRLAGCTLCEQTVYLKD